MLSRKHIYTFRFVGTIFLLYYTVQLGSKKTYTDFRKAWALYLS